MTPPWRRLRVCLVVPGFSTDTGDGCVPAMRAFALRLGRLHDVTVVSLRFPHTTSPYTLDSVCVVPLGGAATAGIHRLDLLRRAVATVLRRGPFDVVHGLWADEPGFVAAIAGRALGARVLVSFMGGERAALSSIGYGGQLEHLGPQLIRTAMRLADRITVGSAWYLTQLPPSWRAKATVLPLAVMPVTWIDRRQQRRQATATTTTTGSPATLRVGQIASLSAVKAPGLLLAAAAAAQRQGAALSLTLIGDGPLRRRLEDQAARLGVATDFTGQVPFADLTTHLQNLDLVVQTSWWESQGMAVLEAAAMGCAVMGSAVGSLAGLQRAWHLSPPGQVAPLAAALQRAAHDPEGVFIAGRQAAAEVMRDHEPQRCLDLWHGLVGVSPTRIVVVA